MEIHELYDHITNANDDDEDALASSSASSDGKLQATDHEEEHDGNNDHLNYNTAAHSTKNRKRDCEE